MTTKTRQAHTNGNGHHSGVVSHSATYTNLNGTTGDRVLAALQHCNQLKDQATKDGGRQYRFESSPFRAGSNSKGFVLTISKDGEYGAYKDHVSGEDGSLYELSDKLGIERPQKPTEARRGYSGLADYAQAHGVTAEYLQSFGWQETTKDDRPALVFQTDTGPRWRFTDGDEPRYKSPYEYQSCLFGLDNALAIRQQNGLPLTTCNGEISTLSAQQYGIPAICITGGSERAWPDHLIGQLSEVYTGPLVVALDCDIKGRKAAPEQRDKFIQAGYTDVRAVDLELTDKGDLADLCRLYGERAGDRLSQCPDLPEKPTEAPTASATDGPRYQLMGLDELLALPPPQKLCGTPLNKGEINMLVAQPKKGKTYLALDWSLQVSQELPTLYLTIEGKHALADRILAWCNHRGKGEGQFKMLKGSDPVNLLDTDQVDGFINQLLLDYRPALVVIDTLAWSFAGGNENDSVDMTAAMTSCKRMIDAIGTTVLIVHHTTKDGKRERGSGGLLGAIDCMFWLDNQDGFIKLENLYNRTGPTMEDQHFRFIPVVSRNDHEDQVLVPAEQVIFTGKEPLTKQQTTILECLAMTTFEKVGAKAMQIESVINVPRSSIYRQLSNLMSRGYVSQADKGEPYFITETGKAYFEPKSSEVSLVSTKSHETNETMPYQNHIESYQSHTPLGVRHETRDDGNKTKLARGEKITVNLNALADADGNPDKALQLMRDEPARYSSTVKVDRRKYQKPPTDESAAK
jgi:hypothetical protein